MFSNVLQNVSDLNVFKFNLKRMYLIMKKMISHVLKVNCFFSEWMFNQTPVTADLHKVDKYSHLHKVDKDLLCDRLLFHGSFIVLCCLKYI